ncbi:MAG: hypothetical protein EA397_15725 [Deltaproteobacteria bacterium]|nr:MAG: hypothetical protein EA397_15725 [Deltaproteobacteria bacterium]
MTRVRLFRAFRPSLALLALGLFASPSLAADKVVEVLEPGRGERTVLRYAPEVGSSSERDLAIQMSSSMDMGGMAVPQNMPTMHMRLATRVTHIADNGNITYDFEIKDISVGDEASNPSVVAPMQGYAKGMVGTKATVLIDPHGQVKNSTYSIPESAPPEILVSFRRSVQDAGAPLPKEPVGVGAKWKIKENADHNGLPVERVSTFTLTSLEGEIVTLGVELQQSAEPQAINDPSLPPGSNVRLERLEGQGQGQTVIDLGQVLPRESVVEVTVETDMHMEAPGMGEQTMKMSMTLKTVVSPVNKR